MLFVLHTVNDAVWDEFKRYSRTLEFEISFD